MSDQPSPHRNDERMLRFACSCTSAASVDDAPWAAIAKQGKLNDGTKEQILNAIARQPRTIAQLAQELSLSPPAIHRHITELLASELIREVAIAQPARRSSVERYYRPNFPIVRAAERQTLLPVLTRIAQGIVQLVRAEEGALADALAHTSLLTRADDRAAVLHCLYATATRLAREQLEAEAMLPTWPEHADGSRWVWWAEEPLETEVR